MCLYRRLSDIFVEQTGSKTYSFVFIQVILVRLTFEIEWKINGGIARIAPDIFGAIWIVFA